MSNDSDFGGNISRFSMHLQRVQDQRMIWYLMLYVINVLKVKVCDLASRLHSRILKILNNAIIIYNFTC